MREDCMVGSGIDKHERWGRCDEQESEPDRKALHVTCQGFQGRGCLVLRRTR